MDARRGARRVSQGGQVCHASSLSRQPPRVLVVDASPPWWPETCGALCEALDNFLTLASSLEGPSRLPLLSLYALTSQQECLLPFVQVRGNLARLRSCVEELRSIPGEGCVARPPPRGQLLARAVLDSLQQFKQYTRHASPGNQTSNRSLEVTVMTSQAGRGVVRQLEAGLKEADLVSLRRLLVVEVRAAEWTNDTLSPEEGPETEEDGAMLGTEIDLQKVENSAVAVEMVLKAWLHEQGGDREHLHLLLPGCLAPGATPSRHAHQPGPVCVKCDVQERLLSPALFPLTPDLGVKTESVHDFLPPAPALANQSPPPQMLRAIKALRADGVCESVVFGLPLVVRPTTCWQLDWDDMEDNHHLFHALVHTLRSRDWFLLVRSQPSQGAPVPAGGGVCSYYVLQPSASLSLLLKPVVSREMLLPCTLPVSNQDPPPDAITTIQRSVEQLEEDCLFNPLSLRTNLYQHLRTRGLLSRPAYPYRQQQAVRRDTPRPAARQVSGQSQGGGVSSRVRATVAPLPPSKMPRPPLTMSRSAPATPLASLDDDLLTML